MATQTFREKKQFLAQHSVAMLEQCCNYSKQCRNNVASMLQRCVALKIVVADLLVSPLAMQNSIVVEQNNGKEKYKNVCCTC